MVKLTQPQFNLLVELTHRQQAYTETYKPAAKLVELGLAELRPGTWSNSQWLKITGLGVARLAMENG